LIDVISEAQYLMKCLFLVTYQHTFVGMLLSNAEEYTEVVEGFAGRAKGTQV